VVKQMGAAPRAFADAATAPWRRAATVHLDAIHPTPRRDRAAAEVPTTGHFAGFAPGDAPH
jgi:hypothetical protein